MLDDSTDRLTRELVDEKVLEWRERGIAVDCLRRTNRQGYKAGAMKEVGCRAAREGWGRVAPVPAALRCFSSTALKSCCTRSSERARSRHRLRVQGMEALAAEGYEFVAVFDADFKPEPGFLHRTLPYLMGNPQVGWTAGRGLPACSRSHSTAATVAVLLPPV